MPDLSTPAAIRDFLKLCLDPPGRPARTMAKLATVMPDWLRGPLHEQAPHLEVLKTAAEKFEADAAKARAEYVKALKAWIEERP